MSGKYNKTQAYVLDAGPLGFIEGLTTISKSTNQPALHFFGGLPYALPPVGPYRFRRPRTLPPCYRYGTRINPGRFTSGTGVCPQPSWLGPSSRELHDENCLQLNIWIPAQSQRPEGGWPIFIYLHGGFLQWGSPNMGPQALSPLLAETDLKCIIVQPAYRLNAFGFLASKELQDEAEQNGESAGNMGFWDQRMAMEWTWRNISLFGGNQSNMTMGGYSAGAHSTFQQLAHELYFVPDHKAMIKRAVMWSNGANVSPKELPEQQEQFDELLSRLDIPLTLSAEEKLKRLRAKSHEEIIAATNSMKVSEFRATNDDAFISKQTIASINNRDFAQRMMRRGIKLMNGECRDEHNLYRAWRTPADSYQAVHTRLCADYPKKAVERILRYHCGAGKSLPDGMKSWPDFFGHVYASLQVHALERGFHKALVDGGLKAGRDLLRYRFDWRAKCIDAGLPPAWGVTHSSDMAIWFWGLNYGNGITDGEAKVLKEWNEAFAAFVRGGEDVEWGPESVVEMRRLRSDGVTDVWKDEMWEEGLKVWEVVNGDSAEVKAKL